MKHLIAGLLATGLLTSMAHATTVTVNGNMNPWLAGQPAGTSAGAGDTAPSESPLEYGVILAGSTLTFAVSGATSNTPTLPGPSATADGTGLWWYSALRFDLTNVHAPINSLLGVFIPVDTSITPTASALDFGVGAGLDFVSLALLPYQVFFIGDGQTSGGVTQSFVSPDTDSVLWLGSMDGYGWYNNSGAFTVTVDEGAGPPLPVVPLPSAGGLLLGGIGLLAWTRRKRQGAAAL